MSRGGTKIKPPFQFTPLREGRHILRRVLRAAGISIHAPPRGATESAATGSAEQEFQFTPLREGRRCGRFESRVGYCISIHAPPRGATEIAGNGWKILFISIHAPPRGATALRGHRRRKRRISIHAPPRGATPRASRCAQAAPISIHAPPRGATTATAVLSISYLFQFTPLREGRRDTRNTIQNGVRISIHAPPRGATCLVLRAFLRNLISIHAPPRGATALRAAEVLLLPDFNSRPSARGDANLAVGSSADYTFQFTPLREGRPRRTP